jgi:ribosomal protein S16
MRVRVVVVNVRGFRDGFERLVRLVGHFEPDLLLLNETGSRRRLRRFANALGWISPPIPGRRCAAA